MKHRVLVIFAGTAAMTFLASSALVSSAQETIVMRVQNDAYRGAHIDIGSGEFPQNGDGTILRAAGRAPANDSVVGRLRQRCMLVRVKTGLALCDGAIRLSDGTVTFEGDATSDGSSGSGTFAITGGTDSHEGAGGDISFAQSDDVGYATYTINLKP